MNQALHATPYRLDDIPLLLGLLMQMGIPQLYDQEIGDHGLHCGLSGGWMLCLWLGFILSQADHSKYKVEQWVSRNQTVLEKITGENISPTDFNDNKLSSLLSRLSHEPFWESFEAALWRHSVEIYDLEQRSVSDLTSAHVDSTTACGFHTPDVGGIMQRGHSKDHRPDLAQLKLMSVAIQPHGQLAATQVVSGNTADDPLYLPIIARARKMLGRVGLLYVGDSKMAAVKTRAEIALAGDYYLTIAPMKGETARSLPRWIERALSGEAQTTELKNQEGASIGIGYEMERAQSVELERAGEEALISFNFRERVQVVRSTTLLEQQKEGLEKRLLKAEAEIRELTPQRARGRRQYEDEESLKEAIDELLRKYRVAGLLRVKCKEEKEQKLRYVSRGRPTAQSEQREEERIRYCIKSVEREEQQIEEDEKRLGWRVQLTNAPKGVSLNECVRHYKENWRGERNYHRLKGEPIGLDPIYVRKDEQIKGLTYLLTLAARVEGVLEWQVERGLQKEGKQIQGLYAGLPKKGTATPTAPAILGAISRKQITLMEVEWRGERTTQLSEMPDLLVEVMGYLNLPLTLYTEMRL